MAYFYFKKPDRIRHAHDDPERKRAEKAAKSRIPTLKFESEGARKDYERRIRSNEHNVYGLPEFFPPEVIREARMQARDEAEREADALSLKISILNSAEIFLYCSSVLCRGIFKHYMNDEWSICLNCKTRKSFHL